MSIKDDYNLEKWNRQLYGDNKGYRVILKKGEYWIVKGNKDLMKVESMDAGIEYLKDLEGA